ncbi:MAG: hypothetical protein J0I75_06090, partial [Hyphomicrobium sp.]|nr:hypothetical protein [Hyphomicrobium sp.]
ERLPLPFRQRLEALMTGRDWFWVCGNHDPDAPRGLGGDSVKEIAISSLVLRHEPSQEPIAGEMGTLTAGNISALHDGAAFVLVVSEAEWERRGRPPALRPVVNAALGVEPGLEAEAPIAAVQKLYSRLNGLDRSAISLFELSEAAAVQAIALGRQLGLDEAAINPEGGAVVRGHPLGAAGAVLVTRLFSRLIRNEAARGARYGVAALGANGGLGLAALFERT